MARREEREQGVSKTVSEGGEGESGGGLSDGMIKAEWCISGTIHMMSTAGSALGSRFDWGVLQDIASQRL